MKKYLRRAFECTALVIVLVMLAGSVAAFAGASIEAARSKLTSLMDMAESLYSDGVEDEQQLAISAAQSGVRATLIGLDGSVIYDSEASGTIENHAHREEFKKALEGKKTYDTWQQGFLQIFEAVQENKPFIINVYRSVSREQVELYLYKLTYDLLIGVVNECSKDLNVREDDKEFIANFYKYAFVGVMLDWVKNDMKEDPKQIIDRLSTLMHGNVSAALERFSIS